MADDRFPPLRQDWDQDGSRSCAAWFRRYGYIVLFTKRGFFTGDLRQTRLNLPLSIPLMLASTGGFANVVSVNGELFQNLNSKQRREMLLSEFDLTCRPT